MAKKDFKSKLDAVLGSIPEGGQPAQEEVQQPAASGSDIPSAQQAEAQAPAAIQAPQADAPQADVPRTEAPAAALPKETAPSLPHVQYPFDADRLMWLAPEHYERLIRLAKSKNRSPEEVLSIAVSFLLEFYPEME